MTDLTATELLVEITGYLALTGPGHQPPRGITLALPQLYFLAQQVDAGQVDRDAVKATLRTLGAAEGRAWREALAAVKIQRQEGQS